ncbi:MAG: P27 family phage terminase small subunit [Oscillospiraceae bacterium]|jgi:phage terminase small subunit|nr:P27 family phage terminase small subunit [Oscillospiraceae bacterium]
MAKDGTYRGGRRVRSGEKPSSLADKITNGNPAQILDFPDFNLEPIPESEVEDLKNLADLKGEDIPKPSDYLIARQKDGKILGADKIYEETWQWLKARRCEKFVNPRLLESYSQAFARYVQCENAISEYGFLGKHPKTGGAIANPFVQMSLSFQKQANLLWYEIFDIVKQNCTTNFIGTPQDDLMEKLLTSKRGDSS